MEILCKNTHHCAGTCQSHKDLTYCSLTFPKLSLHIQTRLQLHTEDGEGGGSTLSTVGRGRGREGAGERRGVGWGRDYKRGEWVGDETIGGEWVGDETIGGEWVGIGLDTCTHIHSCRWTHKHADTN